MQLVTSDFRTLEERVLDSLLFKVYMSPTLVFNSAVLSEALSTGELSNHENDTLKDLVYSLSSEIENIRVKEESIRKVNFLFGDFLYNNYSTRKMDFNFASHGNLLGISKLPEVDNRRVLSSQRFESIVNELYYQLNSLIPDYTRLNENYSSIVHFLEEQSKAMDK